MAYLDHNAFAVLHEERGDEHEEYVVEEECREQAGARLQAR